MTTQPTTFLPQIFLISDARNDAGLQAALRRLPARSALVFRHYHLDAEARRARFDELATIARQLRHTVILSGDARTARAWQANGVYGSVSGLGDPGPLQRFATVHSPIEADAAIAAQVDAAFVSPVHATRSHRNATPLGPSGFHELATRLQRGGVQAIALGGMTPARAAALPWSRWGAIDGLRNDTGHP